MPKTYSIEATITHEDELFGTSRDVVGPADLEEFITLEGRDGVFERALKTWRADQGNELRAALAAKVKGEAPKSGKRAKAKQVSLD